MEMRMDRSGEEAAGFRLLAAWILIGDA